MRCNACQSEISARLRFCDSCGTKVEKQEQSVLHDVTDSSLPISASANANSNLTLKVWKPFRWLVSVDYGEISLVQDHLVFNITTTWKSKILKILFQIFYFGFDLASILRFKSTNQLRNISAISIFKPTWIKWKVPFLVVRSPGFIGIFGVATETLDAVSEFVQITREATANVRYTVK